MPELPEVESLRRLLAESVLGRKIVSARIREPRLRRRVPADFTHIVSDRTICELRRRAKYPADETQGRNDTPGHLGMSGSLTHRGHGFRNEDFDPAHDHL